MEVKCRRGSPITVWNSGQWPAIQQVLRTPARARRRGIPESRARADRHADPPRHDRADDDDPGKIEIDGVVLGGLPIARAQSSTPRAFRRMSWLPQHHRPGPGQPLEERERQFVLARAAALGCVAYLQVKRRRPQPGQVAAHRVEACGCDHARHADRRCSAACGASPAGRQARQLPGEGARCGFALVK